MKLRIVPYKRGSASALMLARELSNHVGYRVLSGRPLRTHKNILWGNTTIVNNSPQPANAISIAQNKLTTFNSLKLKGVSIPEFTTDKAKAVEWIMAGQIVFARQELSSYGGRGIVVCQELPLPNAPLYVKYVKSNHEFRVHVVNGAVIDIQEKRRRNETEANPFIRNLDNGWVFCRQNIIEPTLLRDTAVKAVKAVGLLFGAVDILYNSDYNTIYVLEINTAPGLSDTTAKKYATSLLGI